MHHTHSGAKYCNWHPTIWLCHYLCVYERLCRNRPVRKAATSETAVLEIAGTQSERSSIKWEEEEEGDTGETTPWTVWTLWAPDPTAFHLTPLLKAVARVGDVTSFASVHKYHGQTLSHEIFKIFCSFLLSFCPVKSELMAFKRPQLYLICVNVYCIVWHCFSF